MFPVQMSGRRLLHLWVKDLMKLLESYQVIKETISKIFSHYYLADATEKINVNRSISLCAIV